MNQPVTTQIDNFSQTKALLVTLQGSGVSDETASANLDELEGLALTMGLQTSSKLVVRHRENHFKLLVGTGKAQEILDVANEHSVDLIVFDDDLSPTQQRNWEEFSEKTVIDRQEVILEIFSQRALSREAVLQVGLARMEYSLPRLTRSYTDLSRQRGGARSNRGGGEMKLELDRRVILKKIDQFKEELVQVQRHRDRTRQQRTQAILPQVSIVGYTNAGKSTLINVLADEKFLQEDKLFATLDPTTRRVWLPSGVSLLITDTVGFIQKLPHHLVDAFRSTLEEAIHADFLIHVVDVAHPRAEEQFALTNKVLAELGAGDKPQLLVLNKVDRLAHDSPQRRSWELAYPEAVFTSLATRQGLSELKNTLSQRALKMTPPRHFRFPLDRPDLPVYLRKNAQVLKEVYADDHVAIEAVVVDAWLEGVKPWLVEPEVLG